MKSHKIISLFLFILFNHCHIDKNVEINNKANQSVSCLKNKYYIENICEDEERYIDLAANTKQFPKLSDMTRENLKTIMETSGDIDLAASVFYHRAITDPLSKGFLDYVLRKENEYIKKYPVYDSEKILFAFVPGMFYKDNPNLGTDGKRIREIAAMLGLSETVVPIDQTGPIEENGKFICDYIKALSEKKEYEGVILASLSKGSSDVKMSLKLCGKEPFYKLVKAWYNVGGLNKGTYAINAVLNTWRYRMEGQFYFWTRNYNWKGFTDMQGGENSPVAFELDKPSHILLVNIMGVPLTRHVTERAKPFFDEVSQYGPSDGLTLLADSYIPGNVTYPMFRQDHYFSWPLYTQRIQAIFSYMIERQFCKKAGSCKKFLPVPQKKN
ncbi:hypothetical protein LPTSP4_12190 [Leptospira ryugenii]|uniref:Uncharacterized protein n=1 Tax=Leptospira ryugenii TaxID=1917863 RepID=A0A2P2DYJ9_9LEPT|nr:hypothetical protein [Leptospira ryugenii]GBF49703.1 hypothetical protein LPTSP4_12190 [Leptospira ryugenii]